MNETDERKAFEDWVRRNPGDCYPLRAWMARASIATPSASAQGCTRSHPHENMSAECEQKTEEARAANASEQQAVDGCTEENCRRCRTPEALRTPDMYHAGLSAAAEIADEVCAQSRNPLSRSGAKVVAGSIRSAAPAPSASPAAHPAEVAGMVRQLRSRAKLDSEASEEIDPEHYDPDNPQDIKYGLMFTAQLFTACADMIERLAASPADQVGDARDAKRYRWLEKNAGYEEGIDCHELSCFFWTDHVSLGAAIDAAMSGQQGGA